MESIRKLLGISVCTLLISCALQHRADVAETQSGDSHKKAGVPLMEQFGNPRLWDQLNREQGMEAPFAWESWKGNMAGGTVIGIDRSDHLKEVEFVKAGDDYALK